MNRIHPFIIVLLILVLVPSLTSLAFAVTLASEYKFEDGKKFLKAGDIKKAIDALEKAILADPSHKEAQALLERVKAGQKPQSSESEDLSRHMKASLQNAVLLEKQKTDMEEKLAKLQSEKESLISANHVKDLETNLLQEKLDLLTQKMNPVEIKEFKQLVSDERARLKKATEKSDFQLTFAEKEAKLKAIKAKFALIAKESTDYQRRLIALGAKYDQLREDTFGEKSGEDHIILVLEDYLYFKKEMADQLNGEGVSKAEKFSRHEKMMLSRMEELLALHESIGAYVKFMEKRGNTIRKDNSLLASLRNQMSLAQFDSTRPGAMQKIMQIKLSHTAEELGLLKQQIHAAYSAN